jgi:hypothetical protein
MPARTAVTILVTGTTVVAFGALLPHFVHASRPPTLSLERAPDGATPQPGPNTDLHGTVTSLQGAPLPGAKVLLYTNAANPLTTKTADDGSYEFRNLPIGGPYRVAVPYRGGVFQQVVLLPSSPVRMQVAPTTNSPKSLSVRAASLAVVGSSKGVQAVYAATLANNGASAYAGGVPLPLLPGAIAVDPESGIDRSQLGIQDGMLFSSAPILPGSTSISYTYVAPLPDTGLDASTDAAFATSRFDLLVAGSLRVAARGHSDGAVRLGGRTYHRYTWRNLRAGDTVAARLTSSSRLPLVRTGAIVAGGLLAAAIVAFPLVRRRRAPVPAAAPVAAGR